MSGASVGRAEADGEEAGEADPPDAEWFSACCALLHATRTMAAGSTGHSLV